MDYRSRGAKILAALQPVPLEFNIIHQVSEEEAVLDDNGIEELIVEQTTTSVISLLEKQQDYEEDMDTEANDEGDKNSMEDDNGSTKDSTYIPFEAFDEETQTSTINSGIHELIVVEQPATIVSFPKKQQDCDLGMAIGTNEEGDEDLLGDDDDHSTKDSNYIPSEASDEETQTGSNKRCRWQKSDPSTWQRNIIKKQRNSGDQYATKKRKFTKKLPKAIDCSKCRFKCSPNFTEEDRMEICRNYWILQEYTRKKDLILHNVTCTEPQRRRARKDNAKKRQNVKQFAFEKDGKKIRICQAFFLKTLAISNGPLINAFKGKNPSGSYTGEDKRSKHRPANKTTDDQIKKIKEHIESFPVTESHYVRKSSSRKYLGSTLSIAKMYSLYEELCKERQDTAPSFSTYKRVFGQNYNYSFFKPKKDQCTLCVRYHTGSDEQKQSLEEKFNNHILRKEDANSSKKSDKERASNDRHFVTSTFDLQSVLQLPCSDVSPMYYASKVSCYNLTIYEGAVSNNAFCFTWTEINGKRGSLEIGTCLYLYLTQLPEHVTEVSLFSDTCAGQNRNQNVAALLMYVVQKTHLNVIEQKFLVWSLYDGM